MSKKNSIIIHNIKNRGYRQIHVDGASGGITPTGNVNLSFYSERAALPKGTEFELTQDGKLSEPIKNVEGSKEGVIREFEFGIYMSIDVCESLKDFLEKKIEEFKRMED